VHEWKNLGSPGNGTGIVFYNYNSNSRLRLSDIRVAPWDGRERRAEPPAETAAGAAEPDRATVEFANRDRATGRLHGIRDGKMSFSPTETKLEIPLARAALIVLPVADAKPTDKPAGVQLTLHHNERLTLTLDRWDAREVIAVSPVFGRLALKPEAVRQLRFNPSASRDVADEWGTP
jgi:hypothetical protein